MVLLSCNRSSSKITTDVISKDSMVSIIADLHLADAILLNTNVQSKISDISSNRLYKTVLDKYNITRERFNRSINFYAENPRLLDSLYDKVIERLSLIESMGYSDTLQKK
ncbi:MAG: DUF4296 domain-containing protein [Bacteroidales bacterium]|nr:DUF4296 domain-containing protein [Bacteroidales bacterium]